MSLLRFMPGNYDTFNNPIVAIILVIMLSVSMVLFHRFLQSSTTSSRPAAGLQ